MKHLINLAIIVHVLQMIFAPDVSHNMGMLVLAVGLAIYNVIWFIKNPPNKQI